MSPHHDPVNFPLMEEVEDSVGGQSGTYDDFASQACFPDALSERFKMLRFDVSGRCVVVTTDCRDFGCGYDQRVIGMKKDKIGPKFSGLRKSIGERFFIGGNLGREKDGGGFAPTWLDNG